MRILKVNLIHDDIMYLLFANNSYNMYLLFVLASCFFYIYNKCILFGYFDITWISRFVQPFVKGITHNHII